MRKILIALFFTMHLISFGQKLTFKKVILSDATALANQMQQLAIACDKQNLSALDLFKFQLISGHFKDAISTIEKIMKDTPKEERVYLDLYQQYVKAKSTSNFKEIFRKSYEKHLENSDEFDVLDIDDTLISRDGTDYFVSNFKDTYKNITSENILMETAQNLVKKYFLKTVYASTRNIFFK